MEKKMSVYFDDSADETMGIETIIDTYLAIPKRTRCLIAHLRDSQGLLTATVSKDTASLSKDICDAWGKQYVEEFERAVIIRDRSGNRLFEAWGL
jgi:hypothetical protein